MPFTGGKRQMRAMFSKSPEVAKRWVKKYGVPESETGTGSTYKKALAKHKAKRRS
jgi:hypothetical protein